MFEADIAACFDELAHSAVMDRVRLRIADKRVLALIKAFLKAGVMSADGKVRDSEHRHTPGRHHFAAAGQYRASVLDEHFCAKWDAHPTSLAARGAPQTWRGHLSDRPLRGRLRDHGGRNQAHADALWDENRACSPGTALRLGVSSTTRGPSATSEPKVARSPIVVQGTSCPLPIRLHLAVWRRPCAARQPLPQHPWLYRSPSNPHAMPNRVNPGICRPAAANSDE